MRPACSTYGLADKGKLGRGPGGWALMHDGGVDVFDGAPFELRSAARSLDDHEGGPQCDPSC
jgi:hypothetical protein